METGGEEGVRMGTRGDEGKKKHPKKAKMYDPEVKKQ